MPLIDLLGPDLMTLWWDQCHSAPWNRRESLELISLLLAGWLIF